jgi:hypothetical protein
MFLRLDIQPVHFFKDFILKIIKNKLKIPVWSDFWEIWGSSRVNHPPLACKQKTIDSLHPLFLFYPRAARAENQANQQCHFKSSRWRIELLGTDSCRAPIPMEPPMSNSSMRHREPIYRNRWCTWFPVGGFLYHRCARCATGGCCPSE